VHYFSKGAGRSECFASAAPARLILLLAASTSLAFSARALIERVRFLNGAYGVILHIALPCALAAALARLAFAKAQWRIGAALSVASLVGALYLGELALIFQEAYFSRPGFTADSDHRSKLEVIQHYRRQGIAAYPALNPKEAMKGTVKVKVGSREIIPLGGAAGVVTVVCNEWGAYFVYPSDRYGFANPPEVWQAAPLNFALLGDSYTLGYCVPLGESYAELLRKRYASVLNLSNSGEGPLAELATLREYAQAVRPEKVLWFHFEGNDIEDLTREMLDPIISRYLENGEYSQRLMTDAEEIDLSIKRSLGKAIRKEELLKVVGRFLGYRGDFEKRFQEWVKLYNIRGRLSALSLHDGWTFTDYKTKVSPEEAQAAFVRIMREAALRVSAWGGKLYFIYLPCSQTFAGASGLQQHPFKEFIFRALADLDIPALDLTAAFAATGHPLALFPARSDMHYNARGHRLVATQVADYFEMRRKQTSPGRKPQTARQSPHFVAR
jgi:hypothetical protein